MRVLAVGEALVEFVRTDGTPLGEIGGFAGPFPSGAPAIFASVAARLGATVDLCAVLGEDAFGRATLDRLRADGVGVAAVRVDRGRPTATAHVAYDADGGRTFVFHVEEAAAGTLGVGDLAALPATADWVHVSGSTLSFGAGPAAAVLEAVDRVLAAGGRLSLDPNVRPETMTATSRRQLRDLADRAHVLFPSAEEAGALGLDLAEARRAGTVVCETLGADGVDVHTADGVERVPAVPTTEVDPTGAGDHFAAGFVTATLAGRPPAEAAAAGCAAAARCVATVGLMEAELDPPACA